MRMPYVRITDVKFPGRYVTVAFFTDEVSQFFPDRDEPVSYEVVIGMLRSARRIAVEDFIGSNGDGTKVTGVMRAAVESYFKGSEDFVVQQLDPSSWYTVESGLYSVDRNT